MGERNLPYTTYLIFLNIFKMCDGIWMQEQDLVPEIPIKMGDINNADTLQELKGLLDTIYNTFEETNAQSGESSLNPVRLFSHRNSVEAVCQRVDIKIGKIKELGVTHPKDKNLTELIELLLLLSVALKRKGA